MSDPKKQHITPALIVRRFKVPTTPLCVLEEDGQFRHWNEGRAITRRHYYSLKGDPEQKYDVEKALGSIETEFGNALTSIENALAKANYLPIAENREAILEFVVRQLVRSIEFNVDPIATEMAAAYQTALKSAQDKFGAELVARSLGDDAETRVMHNSRKQSILKPTEAPERFIKGLNISMVRTLGKTEFITGSCPMSLGAAIAVNMVRKHRIVLPVGRDRALMLSDDPEGAVYGISDADTDAVNNRIAAKSKIIVGSARNIVEPYETIRATDL